MVKSAEAIHKAARIYVSILENYPEWMHYFRTEFTQYPMGVWKQIERVGRDKSLAKFLPWYGNPGITRLERLGLSDQRKYAVEPVEIVEAEMVGLKTKYDIRKVMVYELTYEQAEQVFDKDHIRSLSAQRSYLQTVAERERRTKETAAATKYEKPWRVVQKEGEDKKVLIKTGLNGMTFTREDIVEILSVFTR